MFKCQNVQPPTPSHTETIDGATYEVTSNYKGEITFLDLLEEMIQRDMEYPDQLKKQRKTTLQNCIFHAFEV